MKGQGGKERERIEALLERCRYRGDPVGWDAVVGHEPARRELAVVAATLRRHSAAERLGLEPVRGVILIGPPGSGKTLLARALAGAIDRPVYVIPSAEVDAPTIRGVYEALAGRPVMVVWDEADLILRPRGQSPLEDARPVAALCAALDGVEVVTGPITVALTAEPEWALDASALRAGRLTTKVVLDLPELAERRALWAMYLGRVPCAEALDLDRLAARSVGMTGADVAAAVMVALGLSMVDGTDAVTRALLDEAVVRRHHVVESEREGVTPGERERTARHEASHAVAGALLWGPASVALVTISADGRSSGRTDFADAWRREGLLDRRRVREHAAIALAGLAGEELLYGADGVGVGVTGDVSRATKALRRLAGDVAGSERLGPVDADGLESGVRSDRGSEPMRADLYDAVRAEAAAALALARDLLAGREAAVLAFADRLLAADEGTLSGPELAAAYEAAGLPDGADAAPGRRPWPGPEAA